jgi:acyl-[acyl-carrier-protein]-phospholipid O-acyltransferase / long-chain-fatty-acid--[acyl-carrier-protein] ligase
MGFVTIKGRAKRFAKIAGEMVSLAGIEALAAELWPDRLSAVAAVPDSRKGERLILFTQAKDATRSAYQSFAKGRGASDVAIPAEVVVVEAIPMLGTGKIDQVAVTKLALERAKESAAA